MAIINPGLCYAFKDYDRVHKATLEGFISRGQNFLLAFLRNHPESISYQTEGGRDFIMRGIDIVRAAADLGMGNISAIDKVSLDDSSYFEDEDAIILVSDLAVLPDLEYQLFYAQQTQPYEVLRAIAESARSYAVKKRS